MSRTSFPFEVNLKYRVSQQGAENDSLHAALSMVQAPHFFFLDHASLPDMSFDDAFFHASKALRAIPAPAPAPAAAAAPAPAATPSPPLAILHVGRIRAD